MLLLGGYENIELCNAGSGMLSGKKPFRSSLQYPVTQR